MTDLTIICADPINRYKSGFTNNNMVRSGVRYTPELFSHKEQYEHKEHYDVSGTCVDSCNSAAVGTPLYEACRKGSIVACGAITDANASSCFSDKCKYGELDVILNKWCKENPGTINYLRYCEDTPISATKLATIESLVKINKDFSYYVSKEGLTIPPDATPLYELMKATETFTNEQLELLYSACINDGVQLMTDYVAIKKIDINTIPSGLNYLEKRWKALYAGVNNISPFTVAPPRSYAGQKITTLDSEAPAVVVLFKKGTEIALRIIGNMDFPYTSKQASYDYKDPFWKKLLISNVQQKGNLYGWEFDNFPLTDPLITSFFANMAKYGIDKLYDPFVIDMTGKDKPCNCIVFTRTTDRNKFISIIKPAVIDIRDYSDPAISKDLCSNMADLCFDKELSLVQTVPFTKDNIVSNTICDRAISPTTSATDDSFYSADNAKTMKAACESAYLLESCGTKDKRYGTSFEGFTHKENYDSTATCIDACNAATVGTTLYETCRTGALAACGTITDTNIANCFADKCKYAELDTVLNAWCDNNKTDSKYPTYCGGTTTQQPTIMTLETQNTEVITPAVPTYPTQPTVSMVSTTIVDATKNAEITNTIIKPVPEDVSVEIKQVIPPMEEKKDDKSHAWVYVLIVILMIFTGGFLIYAFVANKAGNITRNMKGLRNVFDAISKTSARRYNN